MNPLKMYFLLKNGDIPASYVSLPVGKAFQGNDFTTSGAEPPEVPPAGEAFKAVMKNHGNLRYPPPRPRLPPRNSRP